MSTSGITFIPLQTAWMYNPDPPVIITRLLILNNFGRSLRVSTSNLPALNSFSIEMKSIKWCGTPCISLTEGFAVPIESSLKNCLESAEIISQLNFFDNSIHNSVLPTAVGPAMTIIYLFESKVNNQLIMYDVLFSKIINNVRCLPFQIEKILWNV